jgi:hypothetical protein
MVWTWTWQFCHVPACQRVHCQGCRDVTLELGFLAWASVTHYLDSSHSYTLCEFFAFNDAVYVSFLYLSHFLVPDTWFFSLASTVETDSRPIVLDKTEETTTVDSHQIHRGLRLHDLSSCLIARPA